MHIAIITGGTSTERAVALRSGANMRDWCQTAGHTTDLYDFPSGLEPFLQQYDTYDLVIPVLHGIYGEDGQVTAFLATLGCPYAGSDATIHALCIDKHLTNLAVEDIGIHIPTTHYIRQCRPVPEIMTPFPLIVKPNRGGSSLSTSKVKNPRELISACAQIIDDDILIQECIEGREFTVAVYRDATGYHTLPIMEIANLVHDFFDYAEKYETDGSNEIWMEREDGLRERLSSESQRICEYIGTRGVVRIDWRYDGSDIYFLEVNTIPGFTSGSFVPKMWKKAGKSEGEMVGMLVS